MPFTQKLPQHKYQQEIQSMMFTFGDSRNSLEPSIHLMEEIVHTQMVDVLQKTSSIASRRGSRLLTVDDFIFIVRHDPTKVKKLKEFLSWKDIRKNVKSNTGENTEGLEIGDEDEVKNAQGESPQSNKAPTKRKIVLYWDYLDSLTDKCELYSDEDDLSDVDEYFNESKERLREADLITKEMTKAEYIEYSECRQASFTFKKAKKFRDWLSFSKYIEVKPNDDIIEILGFLAWEIVRIVTETALKVKCKYEKINKASEVVKPNATSLKDIFISADWTLHGQGYSLLKSHSDAARMRKNNLNEEGTNSIANWSVRSSSSGIFERPDKRTPLKVEHIQEACRLLEKSFGTFYMFGGGPSRKSFATIY